MPSFRSVLAIVVTVHAGGAPFVSGQAPVAVAAGTDIERAFAAAAADVAGPAGAAFRARPDAPALLAAKLGGAGRERALAIDHLQRLPDASRAVAGPLLELAASGDRALALTAAVAVGNVAPWWPAAHRERARDVIAALFHAGGRTTHEQAALSRSFTRAQLQATADVPAIATMLRSGDPFRIEFALHQASCAGADARPLLPLLCELATTPAFPVHPLVDGRPRELRCTADWTANVRDQLYWALLRAAASEPAALGVYLERWPRTTPWERFELLRTIGCMGRAAAPALPHLVESTRADWPLLAREAVTVIGIVGVGDARAVERLRELERGADRPLAASARAALRQLDAVRRDR
jgi:hypothetical protein